MRQIDCLVAAAVVVGVGVVGMQRLKTDVTRAALLNGASESSSGSGSGTGKE